LETGKETTTPQHPLCESNPTAKTNANKYRIFNALSQFPVLFAPFAKIPIISNPCAQFGTFSGAKTQLSAN
jgi:hypothetical protein